MNLIQILKKIIPKRFRKRVRSIQWRVEQVWGIQRSFKSVKLYRKYKRDMDAYKELVDSEKIDVTDLWPCLFDKTIKTQIPPHYFYQSAWLARKVKEIKPEKIVDVGSQIDMIAPLSAFVPVTFIDIRPIETNLPELTSYKGSVLSLPFEDRSIFFLSCLHVIEHIGLGRYGDPLDPNGTKKAAAELCRVLANNGNLFISTPVGRERVCFNAHRVHSPMSILNYFSKLKLIEFSCESTGKFLTNVEPNDFVNDNYSCGMFWFRK